MTTFVGYDRQSHHGAERPPLALQKHFASAFDYDLVAAGQRGLVQEHAAAINQMGGQVCLHAIDMGRRLEAVHAILGPKLFSVWCAAEFRWSQGTAERLIRIHRTFGNQPAALLSRFDITALGELAKNRVSDGARDEALKLAASGHKVSQAVAFSIAEKHELGVAPQPSRAAPSASAARSKPPREVPTAAAEPAPATLSRLQKRELFRLQSDARGIIKRWPVGPDRIDAARRVIDGIRGALAEFGLEYLLANQTASPAAGMEGRAPSPAGPEGRSPAPVDAMEGRAPSPVSPRVAAAAHRVKAAGVAVLE